MATKKKARPKKAAKRPAARKPAGRKAATAKRAKSSPKSSSKPTSKRRKRVQRVRAVVQEKARQGLDVAREGLERIKQTTVNLVEEVKERIGNRELTP
jgi:hypothetical protein